MSVALERRLSKEEVLELYLNDVWLGQRGSFAIHGVPEASRIFFGKDIANVSLSEAATIADRLLPDVLTYDPDGTGATQPILFANIGADHTLIDASYFIVF